MSINSVSCDQWLLLQLLTSKLTVVNMVPLHLCRTTSSWISPTDDGFCTHIASPLFLCLRHRIINKFHHRLEKGTCLRLTATDKFLLLHISVSITCLCKVQNSAKSLETPTLFLYFASKESSSLFIFLKSWTVVLQHFWESFKVFLWKQHISCFSSPCTWPFFEECCFERCIWPFRWSLSCYQKP